jgi:hypothetical protein
MVCHYLDKYLVQVANRQSDHLILWADNCGGQNKNSTMLKILAHLTAKKRFRIIDYKFQIKGHTRNSVDRGFGIMKNIVSKNQVYTIYTLKDLLNKTKSINAVILKDEPGFEFRSHGEYLAPHFVANIVGIQSYQMFRFTAAFPTKLFVLKDARTTRWQTIPITGRGGNTSATLTGCPEIKIGPGVCDLKRV